jgi:DNA modification methylase
MIVEGNGPWDLGQVRNRIIHGNALRVLDGLPEAVADLVFLDPPYFLQLPKGKRVSRWNNTWVEPVDDQWDQFVDFDDYDSFLAYLLTKVRRVMKPNATIWAMSTYHSLFRLGRVMQDLGFWLLNDVVWLKTNPMPNFRGARFTNATETLIWAAKSKKSRAYHDHDAAKEFGVGKVGANVWVFPICQGRERLKGGDGKKLHSTQKPGELLRRVILTSTREGDLVLDPLAGTGTTGHVAKALDRDFILIEREWRYVEGAAKRFEIQYAPRVQKDEKVIEYLRHEWYEDGQPCGHPGCVQHVTHPCEGCGRIAGRSWTDVSDD